MTLLCAQNKMIKILGVPLTKTGDRTEAGRENQLLGKQVSS